jgi:hypothetical protein
LLIYSARRRGVLMNRERGIVGLIAQLEIHEVDAAHLDLFIDRVEETASVIKAFLGRVSPLDP